MKLYFNFDLFLLDAFIRRIIGKSCVMRTERYVDFNRRLGLVVILILRR